MRRGRSRKEAAGDGGKCRMCGRAVAIGRDGRCPLGHFVGVSVPQAAPEPDAAPQSAPGEPPETLPGTPAPGAAVGDADAAPPAAEPATGAGTATPQPPAWPVTSPEAGTAPPPVTGEDLPPDLFADFGDFGDLSGDDRVRPDPNAAHAMETSELLADLGGEVAGGPLGDELAGEPLSDELADAGLGDEPVAPQSVAPAPPQPEPTEDPAHWDLGAGLDDLLDWDVTASALDAGLPGPDADPAADVPGEPDADTEEKPTRVEDEEVLDAEDRRVARRRALGILGGTVAVAATVVGSVLALPL